MPNRQMVMMHSSHAIPHSPPTPRGSGGIVGEGRNLPSPAGRWEAGAGEQPGGPGQIPFFQRERK